MILRIFSPTQRIICIRMLQRGLEPPTAGTRFKKQLTTAYQIGAMNKMFQKGTLTCYHPIREARCLCYDLSTRVLLCIGNEIPTIGGASAFRAFRTLLAHGANVSAVDRNRRNVLHYLVERTHNSAFTQEEFLALCQTEDGKRLLNQKDAAGCTPLHLAAKEGTVKCIDTFIPLGANLHMKDVDDRCALHFAAKYGRYNVVKQLLASLGAVNILNETDRQGMTALHIASMNGHTKVVQLLLCKGALLHKDYFGRSPLHLAAQNDFVKRMELLLSFHHNLLDQRDRGGNIALHYAVQANRTRPTDLLLSTGCVYSINDDCDTPIDIALQNQHLEVALVMVKHKRWTEVLDYQGAEAFMGLIRHLPQICHI